MWQKYNFVAGNAYFIANFLNSPSIFALIPLELTWTDQPLIAGVCKF